jgi:hypothetical protein
MDGMGKPSLLPYFELKGILEFSADLKLFDVIK